MKKNIFCLILLLLISVQFNSIDFSYLNPARITVLDLDSTLNDIDTQKILESGFVISHDIKGIGALISRQISTNLINFNKVPYVIEKATFEDLFLPLLGRVFLGKTDNIYRYYKFDVTKKSYFLKENLTENDLNNVRAFLMKKKFYNRFLYPSYIVIDKKTLVNSLNQGLLLNPDIKDQFNKTFNLNNIDYIVIGNVFDIKKLKDHEQIVTEFKNILKPPILNAAGFSQSDNYYGVNLRVIKINEMREVFAYQYKLEKDLSNLHSISMQFTNQLTDDLYKHCYGKLLLNCEHLNHLLKKKIQFYTLISVEGIFFILFTYRIITLIPHYQG